MQTYIYTVLSALVLAACGEADTSNLDRTPQSSAPLHTAAAPRPDWTAGVLGPGDMDYLIDAGSHALRQIALAEVAHERAATDEVRALAEHLATRARATLTEVEALGEDIALPRPGRLTWWDQRHLEELRTCTAETFDRRYLRLARRAQREARDVAEDARQWVHRTDLRQHAADLYATLREDGRRLHQTESALPRP